MPFYNPIDTAKAAGQEIAAIIALSKAEAALRILPEDTKFAIAVEAIARGHDESFYENDLTVMPLAITWVKTPEGVRGRFVGYLSFSDTKVRIHQALDVGAVASGQTGSLEGANGGLEGQLVFEDDLVNVAISMEQAAFVLMNGTQKFKLLQPYQISHVDGRFESSAFGMDNGFAPTFKYLNAHGVNTVVVGKANKAGLVVMLLIVAFVAVVFWFFNTKK